MFWRSGDLVGEVGVGVGACFGKFRSAVIRARRTRGACAKSMVMLVQQKRTNTSAAGTAPVELLPEFHNQHLCCAIGYGPNTKSKGHDPTSGISGKTVSDGISMTATVVPWLLDT